MSTKTIDEITTFWLGPALDSPQAAADRRDWWYKGGKPVDDEIRARFGPLVARACEGELSDWPETSNGAFAMILLLDQFTRNLYRGTPDAYLGDARAFEIVKQTIASKLDLALHPVARIWLYHPYHHAESVADQDKGLALLNDILESAPELWHAYIQRSIKGWTRHRNIVARFGRFPHRNRVLDRTSTPEEITFMEEDGETFGQ